ncbi:MAG: hypothetical protein EU548_09330 [Promethearchaeota archaeon]|nr:MAG: hypothetical protein EU548_09330 [Candidatus Lokiarchaeota archaeon]
MAFKGKYLIIITIVFIMIGSTAAQSYNYANLLDSLKSIRQTTPSSVSSLNISIKKNFQVTSLSTVFKEPFWIKEEIFGTVVSSPTLTDLNNDGELEIIILTDNNLIYILDKNGNFLPDWGAPYAKSVPQLTSKSGFAPCPVSMDVAGDQDLEILCPTFGGLVYCWFLDGSEVPGFPINLNGSIIASPAVGDIDGDNQKEIVIGNWQGELFALEKNGSICPGFPFKTNNDEKIMVSPAVGNLDSDIAEEIVFGAYDNNIYALKGNGSLMPGWPQNTSNYIRSSPALIDFDNDGVKEIMIGSFDRNLYLFNVNGSHYNHWPWTHTSSIYNSPIIGDINQDGYYDAVIQPSNTTLYCFTDIRNSNNLQWNITFQEGISGNAIITDINGDFYPEIIAVSNIGNVVVHDWNGTQILRKEISDKGIDAPPVIADIDNDHYLEMIFTTRGESQGPDIAEIICYKLEIFGFMPWPEFRGGKSRIGMPADEDRDRLSNHEENILGSNPLVNDTDGDTINDWLEVYKYALDPTIPDYDADYDKDGLTNLDEVDVYLTDPTNSDTDGDSLSDGDEVNRWSTNPLEKDTDGDFLPDDFEISYENTNPNEIDTYEDMDEDNLTNIEEFNQGTSPDNPDTDGDGLLDGDEVKLYLTDPLVADADKDSDGDGLTNVEEIEEYGTDPIDADTDGDGYTDYEEVQKGSDPLDSSSKPFPMWVLAPIIVGSVIVISVSGFFIIRWFKKKQQKEV